jgi:hypothetical protein
VDSKENFFATNKNLPWYYCIIVGLFCVVDESELEERSPLGENTKGK